MYHAFVRRKITANFASLGSPNITSEDEGLDPNIEHVFGGDGNAIGGTRHSAEGFQKWVARVYRIFPDLKFTIRNIVVNGWPWNTRVAVEWRSEATTATGERYENDGMHFIEVRLGKIKSMHVYLNTALVRDTLKVMTDKGFKEASKPPITD
jgi:ketosteroid isomerase-like protein